MWSEGVAPYAPKELIGSIDRVNCGRKILALAARVLLLKVQLCIKDCSMLSLRRGSPRRCSGVSPGTGGPTYRIGSGWSGVVWPGPAGLGYPPLWNALWISSIVTVSVIPGAVTGVVPPRAGGIVMAALMLAGS